MRGAYFAERRIKGAGRALRRYLGFTGPYELIDRSSGHRRMLLVVAGYKEWLWPYTIERLAHVVPDGFDVCVVSAGLRHPRLDELAHDNGWSYLWSDLNRIALVQNLAIREHPSAELIWKLDEDVLVSDGYFERIEDGHRTVLDEGVYRPGFCAPVLNVNGYSYLTFLEEMGLVDDYRAEFGEARRAVDDVRVYSDADAARWIWERTLPFDEVADRFARSGFSYSTVPHRFSIGAIFVERAFWEEIGGFLVHPIGGRLGAEEADLCHQCEHRSRAMVVLHDILAGHFSFWPQEAGMRGLLEERADDFAYRPASAAAAGGQVDRAALLLQPPQ